MIRVSPELFMRSGRRLGGRGRKSASPSRLLRTSQLRDSRALAFAPFQLVAQNLEIRFLGGLDELENLFCAAGADDVARLQGDAALAVESQENGLCVAGKFH